ncbi:MAG: adenylate/guanylate cyclase domain-containing protein, partial [Thermoplasmata archaeon]|nr:adenylate/guanylate cyclase domain-containing protein [Thermoplasmata archaeon]
MFTDMVGYTAAVQADEKAALALRQEQEEVVRPVLAAHRGREIKSTGDGFLVEFDSALRAIECAVSIQRRFHERNGRSGISPINIRIGIHLGDVEQQGLDIFGDAVNIAARIEPTAVPGGICISGAVCEQVRNKIPEELEKLPPVALKGLVGPVEIYRVVLPWAVRKPTPSSSGPTRLAVLPFANISADPSDRYLSDGLTEELISMVSKMPGLRVIARTSVEKYRGGTHSVADAARELGVVAVIEGSVRRAGETLRVTAQLIDAETEAPAWSMTFDRKLENVFVIQEELAHRIADSLHIRLLGDSAARIAKVPTRSFAAYELYLQGRQRYFATTAPSFREAIDLFKRAVSLDPTFALAYCSLAEAIAIQGNHGHVPLREALDRAEGHARRALQLDPGLAEAHVALAPVLYNRYDWNGALTELDRALELDPSNVQAHFWRAVTLGTLGRPEDGLANAQRAVELDPLNPRRLVILGQQYYWMRRYDDAVTMFSEAKRAGAADIHGMLAYAYLFSGRS